MKEQIKKTRSVFWLCDAVGPRHHELARRLIAHNYAVHFFGSVEVLLSEISRQRTSIIVVGDEFPRATVERAMYQIATLPQLQGARMILSVSQSNPDLAFTAATYSFKDLIPIDLPEPIWVERFLFACARGPMSLREPAVRLAVNQLASLCFPARMVWLSHDRLAIEARIRPPVGSTLVLSGKFVEALGLQRMNVTVEACKQTRLIYRFSDAVIVRWSVPEAVKSRWRVMWEQMRQTDFGPRIKVFSIIRNNELRNRMIQELDPLRFELNVALQKQSMVEEPKFFGPQIVFIEGKLCVGADLERIAQMFKVLASDVPVYIIGNEVPLKNIQQLDPQRKISALPSLPEKLTEMIFSRLLPVSVRRDIKADHSAVHVLADHPFSPVEVHFSARLIKSHPMSVELALPFHAGPYGLVRVEAAEIKKALGYNPMAKITRCTPIARPHLVGFPYTAEAYLCDVGANEQKVLAAALSQEAVKALSLTTVLEPMSVTAQRIASEHQAYTTRQVANGVPLSTMPTGISRNVAWTVPPTSIPTHALKPRRIMSDDDKNSTPEAGDDDELVVSTPPQRIIYDLTRHGVRIAAHKDTRKMALLVGLLSITIWFFYFMMVYVAPNYNRSGSNYTDALRKFAPQKFQRSISIPITAPESGMSPSSDEPTDNIESSDESLEN